MRPVTVVGAGMTRFGKQLDTSLKELGREAVVDALADAGLGIADVQMAAVGNAAAGLITGQEQIRGQTVLRAMGFGGLPIVNTENACASASTAFHLAWLYVASGMCDVALALGVEKLAHPDKARSIAAIGTAVDLEAVEELRAQAGIADDGDETQPSLFMQLYAQRCRDHMARYGTTEADFAQIAVKNHGNGALNPKAQYRRAMTLEEVLGSPLVARPLTRAMCAPVGDGAAALVLCAAERAPRDKGVRVAASVLISGSDRSDGEESATARAGRTAYEQAGVGPEELDVIELHDASAPAELFHLEGLGICPPGDVPKLLEARVTSIGGRLPVNPSGGLLARGHPIGATGCAQLVELVDQLEGRAGARQVHDGAPRVALAHNGGGNIRNEPAAMAVHVLVRDR